MLKWSKVLVINHKKYTPILTINLMKPMPNNLMVYMLILTIVNITGDMLYCIFLLDKVFYIFSFLVIQRLNPV